MDSQEIKEVKNNMLQQFDIEDFEENQEEIKKAFKINSLSSANWAMRKIKAYMEHQEEIDELEKQEIKRIEEWRDKEYKKTQNTIGYFESLLTIFLYEQREQDPKYKISTPYGSVSTRKQQPKWEIQNEELITWLKETGKQNLIKIKEEPKIKEMKEEFEIAGVGAIDTTTGEKIPGIYILSQQDKVNIKIK